MVNCLNVPDCLVSLFFALRSWTCCVYRRKRARWHGSCWPVFIVCQPVTCMWRTLLDAKSWAWKLTWSAEISGETSGLSVLTSIISLYHCHRLWGRTYLTLLATLAVHIDVLLDSQSVTEILKYILVRCYSLSDSVPDICLSLIHIWRCRRRG